MAWRLFFFLSVSSVSESLLNSQCIGYCEANEAEYADQLLVECALGNLRRPPFLYFDAALWPYIDDLSG